MDYRNSYRTWQILVLWRSALWCIGSDYKEDATVELRDIKMHLMSIRKISNGYWKPATLPKSPKDVCKLFS